jgi:hypothetical protein
MILPYDANPDRMEFSERTAADSQWHQLKLHRNFCNMRDMKMAGSVLAKLNINIIVQWLKLVAGAGLEPATSGL